MAKVNLYEESDIISHAVRVHGIDWNTACDIINEAEIGPRYEINKCEWHINDFGESNPYGLAEDILKIMRSFFEEEDVKEITVV